MRELIAGILVGLFATMFVGFVDARMFRFGIKNKWERAKIFAVNTAWELMFFVGGALIGAWYLQ